MKLLFLIATYRRPEFLRRLIRQIYWQSPYPARIIVVDDASPESYHGVKELLNKHGGDFFRLDEHHGKERYWEVTNELFEWACLSEFDYAFKLDDDIELHPRAIRESIRQFNAINDRKKVAFNMWVDHRAEEKIWTTVEPKVTKAGKWLVRRVGWIDGGNWMANRLFFETLGWSCPKPKARWRWEQGRSSGVGKYLSQKLHTLACHIYMPMRSLIYHGEHHSQMHPHKTDRPIEMKKKPWIE